jgi:hypothetical protein
VLRETMSRGLLCGVACPSRTSERGGKGDCVKEGGGEEGERDIALGTFLFLQEQLKRHHHQTDGAAGGARGAHRPAEPDFVPLLRADGAVELGALTVLQKLPSA